MSETKLYGIRRADGTWVGTINDRLCPWLASDEATARAAFPEKAFTIEPAALVTADRLRALESLVRAADRMRVEVRVANQPGKEGFSLDLHDEADAYDTQRAAVGEIKGD